MQGFNYKSAASVNLTLRQWKSLARDTIKRGGVVREDRKLGETWIADKSGLVYEVYGVNLNLEKTTNG